MSGKKIYFVFFAIVAQFIKFLLDDVFTVGIGNAIEYFLHRLPEVAGEGSIQFLLRLLFLLSRSAVLRDPLSLEEEQPRHHLRFLPLPLFLLLLPLRLHRPLTFSEPLVDLGDHAFVRERGVPRQIELGLLVLDHVVETAFHVLVLLKPETVGLVVQQREGARIHQRVLRRAREVDLRRVVIDEVLGIRKETHVGVLLVFGFAVYIVFSIVATTVFVVFRYLGNKRVMKVEGILIDHLIFVALNTVLGDIRVRAFRR
mmetsp:Transcript_23473/g.55582  ORF Transcript_23473/g.55582 Transcript_23473/m.55582 type:complete len:257 (+) Transcript_23473:633-1403(+)